MAGAGRRTASSAATRACCRSTASCRSGPPEVRGITHLGGTILGTTNRGNPFRYVSRNEQGEEYERDRSDDLVAAFQASGFDALVSIGGDGSLQISHDLWRKGLPVVCVPKTIDNDVSGTQRTFGFDTAVSTATEALDKLHSTAESHERVLVVEVMGRYAGWIALYSGLSGSADVILLPEIPFDIEKVCEKIRRREAAGRHFSIVVVAEGARPRDGADRAGGASRRRDGRPARRDREQGRARHRAPHRQGDPDAGPGPSPARRLAHDLRPAAGAALRRRRRARHRRSGLRDHGRAQRPRHHPGAARERRRARQERPARLRIPSALRAISESAWVTDLRLPAHAARSTPSMCSTARRSPIPTAGSRTATIPTPAPGPSAQNALTEALPRPGAGPGGHPPPARRAPGHRRDQRPDAGAWPLLLPAAGRPAEPARAVRARGRRRRGSRRRWIPTRSTRPARPRSTGTIPSDDGRLLAYGLSENGSEQSVLHVLDVARGATLPDRIPRTRAADLAWLPGRLGVLLHPLSRARRGARGRGALPPRDLLPPLWAPIPPTDPLVFQPAQKEYWPGVSVSPDGRWLLIGVARTFDQTDLYLGDRSAGGSGAAAGAGGRGPAGVVRRARWSHGRLFLRTNLDAPTYRLYEVDPERPARGHWRELVPPRPDAVLEGVRVLRRPARAQLPRAGHRPGSGSTDLDGGLRREVALPTLGSLFGVGGEWDGDELFFGFSSYTVPPSVYRIDLATDEQTLWRRVEADVDPGALRGAAGDGRVPRRHAGVDVPGPPARARARRATRRSISPATAASTSA